VAGAVPEMRLDGTVGQVWDLGGGGWEELYHRLVRPVPVDTDSCHRKKQRDGKRRWIPAPDQVEGRLCAGMTGGRQADIWDKI